MKSFLRPFFLFLLIQEGQLSVASESIGTLYWLTAKEVNACLEIVWLG